MTRQIECRIQEREGAIKGITRCSQCRECEKHWGLSPWCRHPDVPPNVQGVSGRNVDRTFRTGIPNECPLPKGTITIEEDAS